MYLNMRSLWTLFISLLSVINPSTVGYQLTDCDGIIRGLDVTAFCHQVYEHLHGCGKLLLDSMPGPLHPGPDFYRLPWNILLIVAVLNIMFIAFAWRVMCTVKRTINRMREDGNLELERLLAEQSKVQQLEGKIKLLEQDQIVLQNEKVHLEQQSKIMQEKLDEKDLCEDTVSDLQVSSEQQSEVEHVMKSQKWTHEQDLKNSDAIIKIQMEFLEKRAEGNLMSARVAEHALAAERKDNAILRQKIIEVRAQLAEITNPVFVPPLKKDCSASGTSGMTALDNTLCMEKLQEEERKTVQLEENIRKLECDLASLNSDKTNLENLHKILQEKFQILDNLCQQKDRALEQRLAQEKLEHHVKDIRSGGPKAEIRNFKQRIQEINEKHEKAQRGLNKQIAFHQKQAQDNWVVACSSQCALTLKKKEVVGLSKQLSEATAKVSAYQERLNEASSSHSDLQIRKCGAVSKKAVSTVDKSTQAETVEQLEHRYKAELFAERSKVEELGEKIQEMENDHEALNKEVIKLELQSKSFQRKLKNVTELCQQKDQALQQKAAQVDSERRGKELKVKDVLKTHRLKVQAIQERHQKSELSYKAEILSLKKSRDKLMKACASGHALTVPKNHMTSLCKQQEVNTRLAECRRRPSVATPGCSQETSLEKMMKATKTFYGSSDKSTQVKLPNAVEEEQNLHLEKLHLEEKKTHQLEEKILTLEQNMDDLLSEKFQLEDHTSALQSDLHNMTELCEQQEQALQQNTVQTEMVQVIMDSEIQALALKLSVMEEELENSQSCYMAQVKIARAVEEERDFYLERVHLDEERTHQLEEKIRTLERDMDAERFQLEEQTMTLHCELHNMTELCEQQEQALQQNTVQMVAAQIVMHAEIQALTLTMNEELEELQCCSTAHINTSEQTVDEERRCIVALQNELPEVGGKSADFPQTASEYGSGYSYEVLPLLLSDSEDIPVLDQTEILSPEVSVPSTSAGNHPTRPSRSLLEVDDLRTTEQRRRFSMPSFSNFKHKRARILKLFRRS